MRLPTRDLRRRARSYYWNYCPAEFPTIYCDVDFICGLHCLQSKLVFMTLSQSFTRVITVCIWR